LTCHEKEEIPLSVVRDFDLMDDGDPTGFRANNVVEKCIQSIIKECMASSTKYRNGKGPGICPDFLNQK
jgi:hypothetical protein